MKHGIFTLLVIVTTSLISLVVNASEAQTQSTASSRSEMKESEARPPATPWFADRELNVDLRSSYFFSDENYQNDRYLQADHAWGGGIGAKIFFYRYFGLGINADFADARRTKRILSPLDPLLPIIGDSSTGGDNRLVATVLGTLILRYPISNSRFAPYLFGAGGAIFGGGENDRIVTRRVRVGPIGDLITLSEVQRKGDRVRTVGQFGTGIETRLTPHIGLTNDFSWNVIDGANNNFGMVRSGINFAF